MMTPKKGLVEACLILGVATTCIADVATAGGGDQCSGITWFQPVKVYSLGSECQQANYDGVSTVTSNYAGYTPDATIMNLSTDSRSTVPFVCPLHSKFDNRSMWPENEFCSEDEIAIYVVNNHTASDAISCQLLINEPFNLASYNGGTKTTSSTGVSKLTWTDVDPAPKDFWFILCHIPGRVCGASCGAPSGIHSFYTVEHDITDWYEE